MPDNVSPHLLIKVACINLLVILISACVVLPVNDRPVETPIVPTQKVKTDDLEIQKRIEDLLRKGNWALDDNKLTTPLEDNAYFRFLQVLSLDEDNVHALTGIAEIVDKYLEWALQAIEDRDIRDARDYLAKARSVDEEHPNIGAVEAKIRAIGRAQRKDFRLPVEEVRHRSAAMRQELLRIGELALRYNAKVVIFARSDAEGRWIYQQLNDASESRIRARIEIGSKLVVRLEYPGL